MVKIEKPQAPHHLDELIQLADAVMVACGDFGVEMPPEGVPSGRKRSVGDRLEKRAATSEPAPLSAAEARLAGYAVAVIMSRAIRCTVPCACRELRSSVAMMQATDHGLCNDVTKSFDWSADRRILA
jgi:pyruvate kinase